MDRCIEAQMMADSAAAARGTQTIKIGVSFMISEIIDGNAD